MKTWQRWRLGCAAAFFLCLALPAEPQTQITLVPDAGIIVIRGLPESELDALRTAERSFEEWSEILAVRVEGSESASPILGRHEIEDDVLRFHPMFPFDPGRRYVVELRTSEGSTRTVVSLPARDLTPVTRVEAVYPTTDRLPENQLKLYIHFSEPMSGGDGLPFIRLLADNGDEVVDPFLPLGAEFWGRDRMRYTVFFDPGRVKRGILPNEQMGRPILEGRRYVLAIDEDWTDAEGRKLVAPYRKEFVATAPDETPVDPDGWVLSPPTASTHEPFVVDFPEPLDRGLLDRALAIETVNGESVRGTTTVSRAETRWSFEPASPWREGVYVLVALTILEDLAGNQIGKPFEVDVFDRIDRTSEPEVHRLEFTVGSN